MHGRILNQVTTYMVDTIDEALEDREELSQGPNCELVSFTYTTKYNKKADKEYQIVKAKTVYTTEKLVLEGIS